MQSNFGKFSLVVNQAKVLMNQVLSINTSCEAIKWTIRLLIPCYLKLDLKEGRCFKLEENFILFLPYEKRCNVGLRHCLLLQPTRRQNIFRCYYDFCTLCFSFSYINTRMNAFCDRWRYFEPELCYF